MTHYYDEYKHKFVTETEDGDIIGERDLDSGNCESVAQAKYLIRKYREDIERAKEHLNKLDEKYPQDDFPEMWI
jgi:hypothetical protein